MRDKPQFSHLSHCQSLHNWLNWFYLNLFVGVSKDVQSRERHQAETAGPAGEVKYISLATPISSSSSPSLSNQNKQGRKLPEEPYQMATTTAGIVLHMIPSVIVHYCLEVDAQSKTISV